MRRPSGPSWPDRSGSSRTGSAARSTALAYPYGWPGTYTEQTKALAAGSGYRVAFASLEGINRPGSLDPFEVRRLGVGSGDSPILLRGRAGAARHARPVVPVSDRSGMALPYGQVSPPVGRLDAGSGPRAGRVRDRSGRTVGTGRDEAGPSAGPLAHGSAGARPGPRPEPPGR